MRCQCYWQILWSHIMNMMSCNVTGKLLVQLNKLYCWFFSCPSKSMEKLQDLSQSELQNLLDNSERVESMALESDEVIWRWMFVTVHPKIECSVIIYSPSCSSKTISFFIPLWNTKGDVRVFMLHYSMQWKWMVSRLLKTRSSYCTFFCC